MSDSDKPEPVGDGEYSVRQGECMASIAFERGFVPETLWNHPENEKLKLGREDQRVLLPGDRVHIPKLRPRTEACNTDKKHVFLRKGLPETLCIVMLDEDGNARPSLPYILAINQGKTISGTSDSAGVIKIPIPPNARSGTLLINEGESEESYDLQLGSIDPPSTVTGAQARLNNLGYFCGDVDGIAGELTKAATSHFQKDHGLEATGKLDDQTLEALKGRHGF
jgi:N-acetylmuramoyl-L-alanine amidase